MCSSTSSLTIEDFTEMVNRGRLIDYFNSWIFHFWHQTSTMEVVVEIMKALECRSVIDSIVLVPIVMVKRKCLKESFKHFGSGWYFCVFRDMSFVLWFSIMTKQICSVVVVEPKLFVQNKDFKLIRKIRPFSYFISCYLRSNYKHHTRIS